MRIALFSFSIAAVILAIIQFKKPEIARWAMLVYVIQLTLMVIYIITSLP